MSFTTSSPRVQFIHRSGAAVSNYLKIRIKIVGPKVETWFWKNGMFQNLEGQKSTVQENSSISSWNEGFERLTGIAPASQRWFMVQTFHFVFLYFFERTYSLNGITLSSSSPFCRVWNSYILLPLLANLLLHRITHFFIMIQIFLIFSPFCCLWIQIFLYILFSKLKRQVQTVSRFHFVWWVGDFLLLISFILS